MVEVESREVADGVADDVGVAPFVGDSWDAALVAFHARFAPYFGRREVRERSAG